MGYDPTMFGPLGVAVFRIVLGGIFVSHAIPKLEDIEATQEFFRDVGLRDSPFMVYMALGIEVVMGTLLAIGLYTQLAALFLTLFMALATYVAIVKMDKEFIGGYEVDLLLMAASFMYYLNGAGKYGLDAVM